MRHYNEMVTRVFVGGKPFLPRRTRLRVPFVFARFEVSQRFAAKLPLYHRGHQYRRTLNLALGVQVGEGTQHDAGFSAVVVYHTMRNVVLMHRHSNIKYNPAP